MAGRVLNFNEFQEKYSAEAQQDSAAAYSDLSTASDNFQTAFDDTSYDSPQLGPKRPISGEGGMTPPQPGDMGAPSFNPTASGMEAPEAPEDAEDEDTAINPTFGNYDPASSGNPEDEDEDDTDEDDDDTDEDDDDTDEDDKDDEDENKEKANESRFWNKKRSSVILESFDSFTEEDPFASLASAADTYSQMSEDPYSQMSEDPYSQMSEDPYSEESGNWVKCQSCGDTKEVPAGHDPFHSSNVDDPNEWWQGAQFGMQCGCNM